MSDTYWLAKPGTTAHTHCEDAFAQVKEQRAEWVAAFEKVATAIGFDPDRPFYFQINGAGMLSEPKPRPVDNVAIFMPTDQVLTIDDTRRHLRAIGDIFAEHGFETKMTTERKLDNGRLHLKLVLRKKADKERFAEMVGPLPPQREPRLVLGGVLRDAHPDLKVDTLFYSPGTRRLKDGSWLIHTSDDSPFGEGWLALLEADGFEKLKGWEGLKLIEEDQEKRMAAEVAR